MHADVNQDIFVESWYMAVVFLIFFIISVVYGVLATLFKVRYRSCSSFIFYVISESSHIYGYVISAMFTIVITLNFINIDIFPWFELNYFSHF